MDVIVVEDSVSEALLLERQIAALGHQVRGARTGGKAVEMMKERLPNLLVTDGLVPELGGEALTRLVRSQEAARYVYVLFVTSKTGHDAMKMAFAAGADDFMTKPLERDELIARLRVADRIIQLESRLRTKVRELETTLRRLEATSAIASNAALARTQGAPAAVGADDALVPREIAEKQAWKRIESTIQRMLSDFLQTSLSPAPPDAGFQPKLMRSITLTSVTLALEIHLMLSMEERVAQHIAVGLFGPDPDPELVEDTLGELANLAMGGVKTSFAEEGVTLTSGLPSKSEVTRDDAARLAAREQLFSSGDVRIGFALELARCPTRRVRSFELSEGMIFASPVTNEAGILLVPGGVRLVSSTIDRIVRTLPDQSFEVLVPR